MDFRNSERSGEPWSKIPTLTYERRFSRILLLLKPPNRQSSTTKPGKLLIMDCVIFITLSSILSLLEYSAAVLPMVVFITRLVAELTRAAAYGVSSFQTVQAKTSRSRARSGRVPRNKDSTWVLMCRWASFLAPVYELHSRRSSL